MDKKYLIKMLLLNTVWVIWIGLSIFFGCLIADAYFPNNMATFIPFSLIFIFVGGGLAYGIYRIFRKKTNSASSGTTRTSDTSSGSVVDNFSSEEKSGKAEGEEAVEAGLRPGEQSAGIEADGTAITAEAEEADTNDAD